jgi:cell wall integrity and stress response component
MLLRHLATAAILAAPALADLQPARESPALGSDTPQGCYSSVGELQIIEPQPDFNSRGKCNQICRDLKKNVAAMWAKDCYCGNKYPPKADLVDDSECNEPCPGINKEACGGFERWSIYNTGEVVAVGASEPKQSSTSSAAQATSTAGTSPAEVPSATNAPVQASQSTEPSPESTGGSNTVGIAVGVVVGVVALLAVAGGVYYFMKRRRNTEIEEEHRRNAAVNAFISGSGKPPSSSGGLSMSDSRLDPVMANRRMSDGSIADNQDYSRRILRVC